MNRRIADAAVSARAALELSYSDPDSGLTCPGSLESGLTTDLIPPNIVDLHRGLIVDSAKAYLEENAVWVTRSRIDFVRGFRSNKANFDPLTAAWLFLQVELARTELANGLAARISLMVASWPQIMDASQEFFERLELSTSYETVVAPA